MRLKSSPAFSMGSGRRLVDTFPSDQPGPAAYSVDKDLKRSPPRAVFSRAAKQTMPPNTEVPGPGNYPVKSMFGQGPKAVLLSRKLARTPDLDKPGPGNYDPRLPEDHPAYSFGLKTTIPQSKDRALTPGPGAYSLAETERSPRAVFGNSHRDKLNRALNDPGPGAYDVKSVTVEGPKFSFTHALKDLTRSQTPDVVPGPGTYEVARKVVHPETAATLTPRRPIAMKGLAEIPGPGAYTPTSRGRSPAYSIGKSRKLEAISRSKTPSPADYRPQALLKTSPSYAIGSGKREFPSMKSDSPGPGTYTPKPQDVSPKFSMKQKLQASAHLPSPLSPGPGHYSPSGTQILSKPRAAVIGSEPKIAQQKDFQKPPPGTYNISRDLTGPRFSFGRSQRKEARRDDGPGPGQYVIPSAVANVPGYLIDKQ